LVAAQQALPSVQQASLASQQLFVSATVATSDGPAASANSMLPSIKLDMRFLQWKVHPSIWRRENIPRAITPSMRRKELEMRRAI
jgi:hypothetical protein